MEPLDSIQNENSLSKIIIVDPVFPSWRGSIREIDVAGTTSVTGQNGAGKTTLLQLVPVFYGNIPSHRWQEHRGKKSFIDFYLPRTTSFIVYEYHRDGRAMLSVLFRSIEANALNPVINYLFVYAPFSSDLFVKEREGREELRTFPDFSEYLMTQKIQHIEKPIVSASEYRAILYGQHRNKSNKQKYKAYALSDEPMGDVGAILGGIINKKRNVDIKGIIVQSLNNGTDNSRSITLKIDSDAISSFISKNNLFAFMMDAKKDLESLEARRKNLADQKTNICFQTAKVDVLIRSIQKEETDILSEIKSVEKHIQDLENERREKGESFQKSLDEYRVEIKSLNKEIAEIKNAKETYERENIEKNVAEYASLPRMTQSLSEYETRKKIIGKDIGEIENEYKKIDTERKEAKTQRIGEIDAMIRTVQTDLMKKKDEIQKTFEKDRDDLESRIKNFRDSIQGDIRTIAEKIGVIKEKQRHPENDPEDIEKEKKIRESLDTLSESFNDLLSKEADEKKLLESAEKEIKKIRDEIQSTKRHLNEMEEKYKAFLQKMEDDSTFFAFLKEHCPGFESTIGAVISEDLLFRKDLSPEIVDVEGTTSFYGVGIDLSVLPESMTISRINETIQRFVREIESLEKTRQNLNEKEKEAIAKKENIQKNLDSRAAAIVRLRNEKEDCQSLLDNHRKKMEAARNEKIRLMEEEQRNLEEKRKTIDSTLSKKEQEFNSEKKKIVTNRDNSIRTLEENSKIALDAYELEKKRLADDEKKMHENLWNEYRQQLSEKGIDSDAVDRLDAEIKTLEENIRRIKGLTERVVEYKGWKTKILPSLEGKEQLLAKQETLHRELSMQMKNALLAMEKELEVKRGKTHALKSDLEKKRNILSKLEDFKRNYMDLYPSDGTLTSDVLPEGVGPIAFVKDLQEKCENHERDLQKLYRDIDQKMRGISQRVDASETISGYMEKIEGSQDYEAVLSHLLQWYETGGEDEYRNGLVMDFSMITIGMKKFKDEMDNIRSELMRVQKKVNENISKNITLDENFPFQDLVINLELVLEDKVPGWNQIQYFIDRHDRATARQEDLFALCTEHSTIEFLRKIQEKHGGKCFSFSWEDAFEVQGKFRQGDEIRIFTTLQEAGDISSTGLSSLVVIVLCLSLLNIARKDSSHRILLAHDELREIDLSNVESLMEIIRQNNMNFLSAFADSDVYVIEKFEKNYRFSVSGEIDCIVPARAVYDEEGVANVGA